MTQLVYGVFLPNLVVAVVNLLPGVQSAVLDIGTQLVDILHRHELTAQVEPYAGTVTVKHLADTLECSIIIGLQIRYYVLDCIVNKHVAVSVICLVRMQYDNLTL